MGVPFRGRLFFRLTPSLSMPSISFSITILFFLTTFLASVLADDVHLLPTAASSTFPSCGLSCTTLQQAQTGCVPPAAPVTDQTTYVSCFCQSALLTTLKTSGDGVCDQSCTSESDRQLLTTWYNNYCSSGGKDGGATTSSTTAAAAAATTTAQSASSANTSASPQSWIAGHWKWVVMVIVLFVGFSALAIVGTWFKRRHDEKHQNLYHGDDSGLGPGGNNGKGPSAGFIFNSLTNNNNNNNNNNNSNANNINDRNNHANNSTNASSSHLANPEMWGPHQAAAHTRGFDIAPVDDPAFVANSSRTDISSTNTLIGGSLPRLMTSRNGTPVNGNSNSYYNNTNSMASSSTSKLHKDAPSPVSPL